MFCEASRPRVVEECSFLESLIYILLEKACIYILLEKACMYILLEKACVSNFHSCQVIHTLFYDLPYFLWQSRDMGKLITLCDIFSLIKSRSKYAKITISDTNKVMYCIQTLTRHSWIHYTNCYTIMLLQQSIGHMSVVYTGHTYL